MTVHKDLDKSDRRIEDWSQEASRVGEEGEILRLPQLLQDFGESILPSTTGSLNS